MCDVANQPKSSICKETNLCSRRLLPSCVMNVRMILLFVIIW